MWVMKQGSTLFLKFVIILIGVAILGFCIFMLPIPIRSGAAGPYIPVLLGLYLVAVPIFIALFQALKLLHFIDKNKTFSSDSIQVLRTIKLCALSVGGIFIAGMPYIFYVADKDDAPGVILAGLIIIAAACAIAVATAVFQSLLQNAIDIKSENDLTV